MIEYCVYYDAWGSAWNQHFRGFTAYFTISDGTTTSITVGETVIQCATR